MSGFGATTQEWDHFSEQLGLTQDLVPVVSDPDVPISPTSTLTALGKIPSSIDFRGQAVGMLKWQKRIITPEDVARWRQDPRLGICIRSQAVRAFDIDVEDPSVADEISRDIRQALCAELRTRVRANSARRVHPILVEGPLKNRRIRVGGGGAIELLADGHQFVAAGTHPSGARYEWDGGLPQSLPRISVEQLDQVWRDLEAKYGARPENRRTARARTRGGLADDDFDRAAELTRVSRATIEELASALVYFTDQDADHYATWIEIGLALKTLDSTVFKADARRLWHDFSSKSARYVYSEAEKKWESFAPDRMDFRFIFNRARQLGWENLRKRTGALEDATDAGSLQVLARVTDGNLKFVVERGQWLWWDGARWTFDAAGATAQEAALSVAKTYEDRVRELQADLKRGSVSGAAADAAKSLLREMQDWTKYCRSRNGVRNVLALAKADRRFLLSVDQLNRDPWLLGVENGVIDLRTGLPRADAREDLVTLRSPVKFVPGAQAPRWEQFLEEITSIRIDGKPVPRPALKKYLQLAIGYGATGSTREHKMFLAVGEGSNGKNVLLDTVRHVLGPYGQQVSPEVLASSPYQDAERPSSTLARLSGARFAVASESRDGQTWDVSLLKRHTGGGAMSARFMRQDTFEFQITHKLFVMTNHAPELDSIDEAVRSRLHLIPFDMRWNRPGHPNPDPSLPSGDKDLPDKLIAEAEGILAWIVSGAVGYFRDGLAPPEEIVSNTREYLADQHPIGRWLATRHRCEPEDGCRASDLLEDFLRWRSAEAEQGGPRNAKSFSRALREMHVAKKTRNNGTYYGIVPLESGRGEFSEASLAGL